MGSKTCDGVLFFFVSCISACHVPGFMYSCASAVGTSAEEDAARKQQCCMS